MLLYPGALTGLQFKWADFGLDDGFKYYAAYLLPPSAGEVVNPASNKVPGVARSTPTLQAATLVRLIGGPEVVPGGNS